LFQQTKRLSEAEASFRRVLELKPDYAEAHFNLGNLLDEAKRLPEAEASYRRALELKPDYADVYYNLGTLFLEAQRLPEAESSFRRALELKPDFAEAHNNLGATLKELGLPDDAVTCYRRALEIKPDFAEAHSNLLFCLSHSGVMDAQALFVEHCRFGEQYEAPLRVNCLPHNNSRNSERCLQIGMVSGDLRNHAVAYFIEPVLAHLAGYPQLTLHAYANHVIDDSITQRMRGHFAYWHPIVDLSDVTLAQKIRDDGIDILIDLSGHTAENRLLTFARKPAPVQVSWMGYPGTTGLKAMDYYFTDRFSLPKGQFDDQFTEKIVCLPANAPFLPSEDAPAINSLPALSNGYMTFGSFNRLSKLSPSVIALWSQLLRALPDSRMLLGAIPEEGRYDILIEWFEHNGIARERLSFYGRCGMDAYLGLHHQVDVCLDTFPYNGGTTTCHALWMGIPTLTLAGATLPGRVGAAILGHVGLEGFVAHDAADFVQMGLFWADNLAALSDIRTGLRERFANSAMGQPALVAAGVERALRTMWKRWCADVQPESFEVSLQ
jgi:predicted O-linked N-acetylglucosamine transferase (SPINDLY family)